MLTISIYVIAWALFIVVIILILGFMLLREELVKKQDELVQLANKDDFFEKKPRLLRTDELEFYNILKSIIREAYYIFPQVHLSEMVDVKNNFKDHDNLYEILGNKSVDFGIFTKDIMTPKMAIELNGKYHLLTGTTNKDALKKNILDKVGVDLIFVDKDNYNLDELSKDIKWKLNI